MANCKFCGKPVTSSPVHHAECWKEAASELVDEFCDNHCRHPLERRSLEEMQELYCSNCPLVKILNLGL